MVEKGRCRQSVVRTTLESIYILAHLLTPFIPEGSAKIFRKLNTEPTTLAELNREGHNLAVGTRVDIGDVLYSKVGVYSWCWCMYNETCYLH